MGIRAFLLTIAVVALSAAFCGAESNINTLVVTNSSPASNITATTITSAAPSGGTSGEGKQRWQDKVVTVCLALLTTIITNWLSSRSKKKDLLHSEFRSSLKELRTACEGASQKVNNHLTADPFVAKKQRESQATILIELKLCGDRLTRAMGFMDKTDADALENDFLKWRSELTGAPFPVLKKDFLCKAHDGCVLKNHEAHKKWCAVLDQLSTDSVRGKLHLPLTVKQNHS